jgi:chromosomal replication initiation ATPase DnaA
MGDEELNSPTQLYFDLPVREAFEKEDFLLSHSNEEAANWINKWPQWGDHTHCLIIYGLPGCGKTHLSYVWQKITDAKTISATKLQEIEFLRNDGAIYIVEDVDETMLMAKDEEVFLHLYNWAKERNGYLLLTAKEHPKNWNLNLADLKSRVLSSPAIRIKSPGTELLQAVIIKQFNDRQIYLSQKVLKYIMLHTERSFETVRILIQIVDTLSLTEKKKVSISLVKRALEQMNAGEL